MEKQNIIARFLGNPQLEVLRYQRRFAFIEPRDVPQANRPVFDGNTIYITSGTLTGIELAAVFRHAIIRDNTIDD